AAVALALLLQVAALTALAGSVAGAVAAGVAVLLGRHGLAWACAIGVPSARPSGLGATVAGSLPRRAGAACAVRALVLASVAVALAGAAWWLGAAMWAGGMVASAAVLRRCTTRLGGVTGDVLGAVVELGVAASLTVAAVLLPHAG
ncbi:MAG: adenosylcobinamide-GDP ribazoletransferase, partial [Oryzihumus sp.]